MTFRLAVFLFAAWGFLGGMGVESAVAQDVSPVDTSVVAQFDEARALAVDPLGRFYVVDAGRNAVVVFDARGTQREVIGGSGSRAGEFDTPSDVDPTNGQVLLVADTYNGRVQRLSEEGQFLESLPVGGGDEGELQNRGFDDGRDGAAVRGDGRPIAVASRDGGTTFILDARTGALLRWSELRGVEQVAGGPGETNPHLQDPVALALGQRGEIYVADGAQEAVLVFDGMGTFVRRLPTPSLPALQALTVHEDRLWIVESNRLLVWNPATNDVSEAPLSVNGSLEDIAPQPDALYILTEDHLIRQLR